jgi:hypothetical protein
MTDTDIAAIKMTLEINKQLLRETPELYDIIERCVREYLATKGITL